MKYALGLLLLAGLAFSFPALSQDNQQTNRQVDQQTSQQTDALPPAHAETDEHVHKRLIDAAADLDKLTGAGDSGISDTILADAKCVAIVPSLVKGGFVFGAEHGRGVATCRTGKGWSAPAFFVITGGNWGAQIGLEGVDLVMFFMTREGTDKLLSAKWKIGAEAGIAAGPYGRDVSANTDIKANTSILTYSRGKGVFIGADLDGANVHADERAIAAFYGKAVDFRDILTGKVNPPPAARQFLAEIRTDFHEAQAGK